jgi:hypothetical protein
MGAWHQDRLADDRRPLTWHALEEMGSKGSRSRHTVKYGHESRATRKQESLFWQATAAI